MEYTESLQVPAPPGTDEASRLPQSLARLKAGQLPYLQANLAAYERC